MSADLDGDSILLPPVRPFADTCGALRMLRPWPWSLSAFCLLMIAFWFMLSGMHYEGTLRASSFVTAGWFTLGSPVLVLSSMLYAAFVAMLARRRKRRAAAWTLALAVVLLADAVRSSLPASRAAALIGKSATIEEWHEVDSFNGGRTAWGVISGPRGLLATIAVRRALAMKTGVPLTRLQSLFPAASIPETGPAAIDDRSTFYYDKLTGKIYFVAGFG